MRKESNETLQSLTTFNNNSKHLKGKGFVIMKNVKPYTVKANIKLFIFDMKVAHLYLEIGRALQSMYFIERTIHYLDTERIEKGFEINQDVSHCYNVFHELLQDNGIILKATGDYVSAGQTHSNK